ncbi:MAG TPA: hypothetical protein VJ499_15225 [Flavisolibacter sp.]|nr:hypothetical protein [Flavisolibacter sp.]
MYGDKEQTAICLLSPPYLRYSYSIDTAWLARTIYTAAMDEIGRSYSFDSLQV